MHYQLHSQDTKEKIREGRLGKNIGEHNPIWKGDQVSYRNLHRWVERWAGKADRCSEDPTHFSTRYHWANISGEYKRDLKDFRQLCPGCNLKERHNMKNYMKGRITT